jgi:uncharacterized protein
MSKKKPEMTIRGDIHIDYQWSAGKAGERFLVELRDHKRIMGTKCRVCGRVMVPPRIFCEECFVDSVEWVEVEPRGRLVTFGECYFSTDGKKLEEPWVLGIVRLDGADGGLIHFIREARAEDLYPGMLMEIVFKDQREGHILDISHFRPVASQG